MVLWIGNALGRVISVWSRQESISPYPIARNLDLLPAYTTMVCKEKDSSYFQSATVELQSWCEKKKTRDLMEEKTKVFQIICLILHLLDFPGIRK